MFSFSIVENSNQCWSKMFLFLNVSIFFFWHQIMVCVLRGYNVNKKPYIFVHLSNFVRHHSKDEPDIIFEEKKVLPTL